MYIYFPLIANTRENRQSQKAKNHFDGFGVPGPHRGDDLHIKQNAFGSVK